MTLLTLRQYLDENIGGVIVDEGHYTAIDGSGESVVAVEWSERSNGPRGGRYFALSLPNTRSVRDVVVVLNISAAAFGTTSAPSGTYWNHDTGRHVVTLDVPTGVRSARDWARSAFDVLLHDASNGLRLNR